MTGDHSQAPSALPAHVAIIMDGNGRWAESRGLPRTEGHRAGIESVREVTTTSAELGLRQLTLYAFSTENFSRPRHEVTLLMRFLREFLGRERPTIMENNIQLRAIGDLSRLPTRVRDSLDAVIAESATNDGMVLCLALAYGARQEIVDAARALARQVQAGQLQPEEIDESHLTAELYDPRMPDPDLLIRTAGEMRLSNFLLWQLSYSELYITPTCWPDFRREALQEALQAYAVRTRTYGGLRR